MENKATRTENLSDETKKYDKTKYGAKKRWELERCLNDRNCPFDSVTKENLTFFIAVR